MIKSKIDARERALEFVVSLHLHDRGLIMDMAKEFTDFLIGDTELPEVFNENTPLKEFIEMAKKSVEDINKQNDDLFGDIIKTLPEDVIRDKGLVGLIPCKSDVE
jgi:hypothetical protein